MRYLALGDSISIDDYTDVVRGGAASQLADLLGVDVLENRAFDGCTTDGVLDELAQVTERPDLVTVTVCGNDFILGASAIGQQQKPGEPYSWDQVVHRPLGNLRRIAARLAEYRTSVILSTVYDPTDGDDGLASVLGIPADFRPSFEALNAGVRQVAALHDFMLADLQALFRGHGIASNDTWITHQIEPNHAGATAVARHWHALYAARPST